MKSLSTFVREKIKNFIIALDYLLWILLDFSKFKKIDKNRIKKVLIIHLGPLGELILATPVVSTLKKQLKCEIEILVAPGREIIFKNNPHVSRVLTFKGNFKQDLEQIKGEKFDAAIIITPGTNKIAFMCFLAGIKYRIGCYKYAREMSSLFFTRRNWPLKNSHIVKRYLNIIKSLKIYDKSPQLDFFISKKDVKKVNYWLRTNKINKYIIIHPGFGTSSLNKYPSRWWSAEKYARVADTLIGKYNIKVLLTGSKEEQGLSKIIKEKCKNKKNVIITNGLFNLSELAALIQNSKLLIATSTSVIHIASALEKKLIQLSGIGGPIGWHPWTSKDKYREIFHSEVCTECYQQNCRRKDVQCMKAISVEEVLKASEELLN